jgi:hypothetical protein
MAARGYWQAFQAVQKSLETNLKGENPGEVADADHGTWYRELFVPGVTVGLLKPADLAGYGNGQVYIRKSTHVPLNIGTCLVSIRRPATAWIPSNSSQETQNTLPSLSPSWQKL